MEIRQRILDELTGIESRFGVTILFACESGSRAWGFESTDSDYDVRFVYWHGLDWYLSVARTRNVIELPISGLLDINGWELRKALGLARRSNPTLLEWIDSPILYREHPVTAERFRALVRQGFSPATCFRSYLHMAQGNFREYLRGEAVWTKKYLYVLRPVLACRWIERGLGPVPMRLADLVARTVEVGPLRAEIDGLVSRKKAGEELDSGPRIPAISEFLESELERLETAQLADDANRPDSGLYDAFMREVVRG